MISQYLLCEGLRCGLLSISSGNPKPLLPRATAQWGQMWGTPGWQCPWQPHQTWQALLSFIFFALVPAALLGSEPSIPELSIS